MNNHQFTLIVDGPDLQDPVRIDALFEAGCDDAMAGRVGSIQYLDFDRQAETFADAVLAATDAIENAVPGARVVHLEADDLVTMSEIAHRTGRSRESIRLLVRGERGPGGFPAPATHFKRRQRMWRWQRVATWFAEALGEPRQSAIRATPGLSANSTPGCHGARSRTNSPTLNVNGSAGSLASAT